MRALSFCPLPCFILGREPAALLSQCICEAKCFLGFLNFCGNDYSKLARSPAPTSTDGLHAIVVRILASRLCRRGGGAGKWKRMFSLSIIKGEVASYSHFAKGKLTPDSRPTKWWWVVFRHNWWRWRWWKMEVNLLKGFVPQKTSEKKWKPIRLTPVSGGRWVERFLKTLLVSEESAEMIFFSIRCYSRLQNVHGKVMIVFVRVLLRETRNGRHLNTWDTWDTWQLLHRSENKNKDKDKYCLLLYACLWSESYKGLCHSLILEARWEGCFCPEQRTAALMIL